MGDINLNDPGINKTGATVFRIEHNPDPIQAVGSSSHSKGSSMKGFDIKKANAFLQSNISFGPMTGQMRATIQSVHSQE